MASVLVTGGSGFFGGLLKQRLLADGHDVVNIDLYVDSIEHSRLLSIKGDIRNQPLVAALFDKHRFDYVYHCAAVLAHDRADRSFLWTSNVDGTEVVAKSAQKHQVKSFVFISSNCLWGQGIHEPVREDHPTAPVEIYGRSKDAAERVLQVYQKDIPLSILRCPTIIDEGRLGLLAILFEFIREGRKVWVVGGGLNRYQFIYAKDLIDACLLCTQTNVSNLFHIGSDNVKSLRDVYGHVIAKAGTASRVTSLPKAATLAAMHLAYHLRLSPLGPYQYKMIAEDFEFSTEKIKRTLGWTPTMQNEDMLWLAYQYYAENLGEIKSRKDVSAHRQPASMGIIRLLKWMS